MKHFLGYEIMKNCRIFIFHKTDFNCNTTEKEFLGKDSLVIF